MSPSASEPKIPHHFTVDVEEYFQVSALERYVPRSAWSRLESRVARSVQQLLDLMSGSGVRGTFFVLGWVADRQRLLIRDIAARGHEIASHGWDHRRVMHQPASAFRQSVRRTKRVLEDIAGQPVVGFRAPSFSIVRGCEWALEVLVEEGYAYDSSLFPVTRRGYGYLGGARDPHVRSTPAGDIAEIPPTTLRRWGVNLPAAGGAYFRLLPYALARTALRECEWRGAPGTFYIHPWEVDPDQPRLTLSWSTRVRHYGGLKRTLPRLERLLREFDFSSVRDAGTLERLNARHEC